jgi:hypothetical protein
MSNDLANSYSNGTTLLSKPAMQACCYLKRWSYNGRAKARLHHLTVSKGRAACSLISSATHSAVFLSHNKLASVRINQSETIQWIGPWLVGCRSAGLVHEMQKLNLFGCVDI